MKTRSNFRQLVPMMALAFALLPLTVLAQGARLKMPDFSGLAAKAKETVDIDMDRDTLKTAMGFMAGSSADPQVAEQLKGLESVTVKVFSFDKPGAYSMHDIDGLLKQVESRDWKKLMSVRESGNQVEMWMREAGANGTDGGMFFVAAEPNELVVINITGKVDLSTLAQLQGRMGMPNMGLGGGARPAPPAPPAAPAAAAAPAPAAPAAPPAR